MQRPTMDGRFPLGPPLSCDRTPESQPIGLKDTQNLWHLVFDLSCRKVAISLQCAVMQTAVKGSSWWHATPRAAACQSRTRGFRSQRCGVGAHVGSRRRAHLSRPGGPRTAETTKGCETTYDAWKFGRYSPTDGVRRLCTRFAHLNISQSLTAVLPVVQQLCGQLLLHLLYSGVNVTLTDTCVAL